MVVSGRRQCIDGAAAAVRLAAPRWSGELAQALAGRPNAWLAFVAGVPPGKKRCSYIGLVSFVYDAKRWLKEVSMPYFLLLERQPNRWRCLRGYLGSGTMRGDGWHATLR